VERFPARDSRTGWPWGKVAAVSGPDDLDALIARAQKGDLVAFEALVESHIGQVRRFARAFAADEHDADDLAQEALLKVHRGLCGYRSQSAFSTWLFAVVRRTFLDVAKGRARRAGDRPLSPADSELSSGDPRPDEAFEKLEERQRVWEALRKVPAEFRSALVLYDLEGHPYDEVAAIERVPVGTVKSRLARGRAHLREALLAQSVMKVEAPSDSDAPPGTSGPLPSSHVRRSGS
jgi:RNA polymerase sigma-70 factor, ECF subfamily